MAQGPLELAEVIGRVTTLRQRFEREHRAMRSLDPWRHMDKNELERVIWEGLPENEHRETIPSPVIQAVTDSVVALLTAHHPTITVRAKNTLDLPEADRANFNERIGLAIFNEIDRYREESILAQLAEYVIHRGKVVLKALWLDPEERGEKKGQRDPLSESVDDQMLFDEGSREFIEDQGEFPVMVVPLDPIECYYTKNPDRDEVTEFIHEYYDTWDHVCHTHPGIEEMEEFGGRSRHDNSLCLVIDHWDKTHNTRIVDGKIYAQYEHKYKRIPFIVQNAKLKHRNSSRAAGRGSYTTGHSEAYQMATPFCLAMLEDVRRLSLADSIEWTHLSYAASGTFTLEGLDPEGKSPNWSRARNEDGTLDAEPNLNVDVEIAPGSVVPLFGQERLRPLEMPRLSEAFQSHKAARVANIEQVSFSFASLAGITMERLSGFSATQQGKLSIARTKPYELALNRALSRLLEWIFEMLAEEWQAEERNEDMAYFLHGLTEEQDVELTPEIVRSVGMVRAAIAPMIPTEKEQEIMTILQLHQTGVMPLRSVVEELSQYYDSMRDPKTVMHMLNWDNVVRSQPEIQMQLAMAWAKSQGLLGDQEEEQPPEAPGLPGAGPMADPMAAMMADPMMAEIAALAGTGGAQQAPPAEDETAALAAMMGGD